MELSGRIIWYEPKKGYGFIEATDGSGNYFVHFGDVVPEHRGVLSPGDRVKFEPGETPYGPRALHVRKCKDDGDAQGVWGKQ